MYKYKRRRSSNDHSGKNTMKLCSINIGGMSEKSKFLLDKHVNDEQYDMVFVQETGTTDIERLRLHGMTTISDCNNAKNRGVSFYLREEYSCSEIPEIPSITNNLDTVWALVVVGNTRYIVGNVYVKHHYENAISDVMSMLDKAKSLCRKLKALGVIVCGDFNSRHTLWNDSTVNKNGKEFLSSFKFEDYAIFNPDTPTFLCVDGHSTIDLCLVSTNLAGKITSCTTDNEVDLGSGAPDRGHVPVIIEVETNRTQSKRNISQKLDIDSINWEKWATDLETELTKYENDLSDIKDPLNLWSLLEKSISNVTSSNASMKKICKHSKPFWTDQLTRLCNEMRIARKAYQKRNTDDRKAEMIRTREAFDEVRKKECEDFIMNKTKNLNIAEAKTFWKKFNALFKKKEKPGIDPLQDDDGSFLTSPEEIEEKMFETFFQCKHMISGDFDDFFYNTVNNLYEEMKSQSNAVEDYTELNSPITMNEIKKAIKSTDMTKTSLDNFNMHPKMLINLRDLPMKILQQLFNLVLKEGKWVWNTASVIFLRKNGKKSYRLPGSYRPICITSYIGKLLEKIIAERVNAFLIKEKYLDPTQEGFTVNKNTIRYLNRLQLEIKSDLNNNKTVIALFADMEKAFDSVWKRGLIVKLSKLKIKGKILDLIDDFLFSRIVKLSVNCMEGQEKKTEEYGLPQGSALSPVLFKIYMLDLLEELEKNTEISVFKFADDATVKIRASSNQQCIDTLHLVTNYLHKWSKKWRMIINCDPNKTEYICFGSDKTENPIPETIQLGDKTIKRVSQTKVLGLIMDENLSYIPHCEEIHKRLLGKWAQICQYSNSKWGFNQRVLTRIIQTIFIPIMQYAGHIYLHRRTLEIINKIWYKLIKSTIGATFNVKQEIAEVILGLPPPKLQTSINQLKHYLKLNITKIPEDKFKEVITSNLNSDAQLAEIQNSVKEVYKFLQWKVVKYPEKFNPVDLNIISRNEVKQFHELSAESCKYTKTQIKNYTEKLWAQTIKNQQIIAGDTVIAIPKCESLPIPNHTDRSDEVLLMSLFYPNNLMNSFVYRHTYNAESPLCPRCNLEEETPYHVIIECNDKYQEMQNIAHGILGEAAQEDHCNTLINCSRESKFIKCALEILKERPFRRNINGIIPA